MNDPLLLVLLASVPGLLLKLAPPEDAHQEVGRLVTVNHHHLQISGPYLNPQRRHQQRWGETLKGHHICDRAS